MSCIPKSKDLNDELKKRGIHRFQGRAGDHNDLAMPEAKAIGNDLASRTGVNPVVLGNPAQAMNTGWR